MNTKKIEQIKDTIVNSLKSDFMFKMNEVLSVCDSEIEKLMVLQLYNYFQNYGKEKCDHLSIFSTINFIDEEIAFWDLDSHMSELDIIRLKDKVNRLNYRHTNGMYYKNIGFKVSENYSELRMVDDVVNNPEMTFGDSITREFIVYPQYEVKVNDKNYKLDIAIILNRFQNEKIIDTRKIGLECDGYDYHGSPQQKRDDDIRTRKLKAAGWKDVFRYSGTEIYNIKDLLEVHYNFEDIVTLLML